ncbi:MAG: hypothetical protein IGBAC_0263 [Ignavibacteriae bacterium]|nr:MAG: hypothetical protein IGBAC_0263 [Ignavibacteriota bacterium]
MKKIQYIIILLLGFSTIIFPNDQINKKTLGIVKKAINKVEKKEPETEWIKAEKGTPLFTRDQMRTGKKSVAVIKFSDNSILRVLENSELILLGEKSNRQIINNIKILKGFFGFDIIKLQNEQYTFESPTSVASIRGTRGIFSHQNDLDILIVLEGIVNIKNVISGQETEVKEGQICFSYADGKLETRKATEEEVNTTEENLKLGEIQKDNELKLELRDSEGNKKELKLKYKE